MTLPETDHIARTCKYSSLDLEEGKPTVASFDFRPFEKYLSVNWLELLAAPEASLADKVQALRAFSREKHDYPCIPIKGQGAVAAVAVAAVHKASVGSLPTTLRCAHEPHAEGDPHSGIHPDPGVERWSEVGDDERLAVQQYLYKSICHWEPATLP